MNNLLLLGALAAGYVYFTKPKTTTKKSTETKKTEPKTEPIPKDAVLSIGSKEIGYAIYDCNLLIIYDAQKAYNYAFDLGLNTEELNGQFDDILFGKCFENAKDDLTAIKKAFNSSEKAKFAFNLLRYAYSGFIVNTPVWKDEIIEQLKSIKSKFVDYLGFDASNFDISLIVNNNPLPLNKGFTIKNCETLIVTDSIKMKKYTEGTFQQAFESSNFKATDPNAPFDFAVDTLKILAPDCYAKITSKNFNKDNFVISSALIFSGFIAYLSFRFMVKNGQVQNDAWKDSFETIDEFNAYLVSANKVLQDWIQPLLIKFGFTEESLKALYEEIQKVGKYPIK